MCKRKIAVHNVPNWVTYQIWIPHAQPRLTSSNNFIFPFNPASPSVCHLLPSHLSATSPSLTPMLDLVVWPVIAGKTSRVVYASHWTCLCPFIRAVCLKVCFLAAKGQCSPSFSDSRCVSLPLLDGALPPPASKVTALYLLQRLKACAPPTPASNVHGTLPPSTSQGVRSTSSGVSGPQGALPCLKVRFLL